MRKHFFTIPFCITCHLANRLASRGAHKYNTLKCKLLKATTDRPPRYSKTMPWVKPPRMLLEKTKAWWVLYQ